MPLTSQIKELGAIYTFGIKNWLIMNLEYSGSKNETRNDGLALLAMRMNLGLATSVVGSVQQRKQFWFSQELERWEKESHLNSVG